MKRLLEKFGDLFFVLACAAATIAYVVDAQAKSRSVENLAFIVPLAIAILGLCLLLATMRWRASGTAGEAEGVTRSEGSAANAALPFYCFGLLVAYVLSIPHIGFDLANMVFVALFVWLQAARQPLHALLFGALFGLGAAWAFQMILPYRLPMTLL